MTSYGPSRVPAVKYSRDASEALRETLASAFVVSDAGWSVTSGPGGTEHVVAESGFQVKHRSAVSSEAYAEFAL